MVSSRAERSNEKGNSKKVEAWTDKKREGKYVPEL